MTNIQEKFVVRVFGYEIKKVEEEAEERLKVEGK